MSDAVFSDEEVPSEDTTEVLGTLLFWMQKTFPSLGVTVANDLSDGFALYRAGSMFSPEYFPADEAVATQADSSWMMKSNTLRKVCACLVKFFDEVVGLDVEADFVQKVDVVAIAKENDLKSLVSLMELLLAAAINSSSKQVYIQSIMEMDADVQEDLMYVIQEFAANATPSQDYEDASEDDRSSRASGQDSQPGTPRRDATKAGRLVGRPVPDDLDLEGGGPSSSTAATDKSPASATARIGNSLSMSSSAGEDAETIAMLTAEVKSLKMRHRALKTEHESVLEGKEILQQQLQEAKKATTNSESQAQALKAKERALKAEVLNAEHAQELERRLERAEQHLNDARASASEKQRELMAIINKQADELDVAKALGQQQKKTELALAKAKQRLAEASTLRAEITALEDQNTEYMEKMLAMESTVSTIPQLKAQVEQYKNKVVDLDSTVVASNVKAQQHEKECAKLKELVGELRQQRKSLKEELETKQMEIDQLNDEADVGSSNTTAKQSSSSEDKATIERLERQVKALRAMQAQQAQATSGSGGAQDAQALQVLRDELEDTVRGKKRLQAEFLKAQEQIAGLMEAQSTTAAPSSVPTPTPSSPPNAKVMERLKTRNERLAKQNNELKQELMDLEQKLGEVEDATGAQAQQEEQAAVVDQLKEMLKSKETQCNQLSLEKEKLENYVKQALKVTKMKYRTAVQSLQEQSAKKDEVILELSKKNEVLVSNREHMKHQHRMEERLVISALYEVGLEMQRRTVAPNPTAPGGLGSSWLSRARRRKLDHDRRDD